jgi:excisionase family DNA binding protein
MSVHVDFDDSQARQKAAAQLEVPERSIEQPVKQIRTPKRTPRASFAVARLVEPSPALQRPTGALSGLEGAFLAFLQSKTSNGSVPVERRIFLTMAESAEFSGLPVAFLRRLIASGKLKALRTGSGWRVSRVEIEKVAGTLTDRREELSDYELREMDMVRRRRQGLTINSDNT